jgi:hypothetical protein
MLVYINVGRGFIIFGLITHRLDSFKDMAKGLIFSDTCISTEQNDSKYRENKIITMFGVYVKCNRLSWHQFHNYVQDGAMT